MICATIKKGLECPFMTAKGCSYSGGLCNEVVEQCEGCKRGVQMESGWYCAACPDPSAKWKNGNCNMASHVTTTGTSAKVKLNPLKASKRGGH